MTTFTQFQAHLDDLHNREGGDHMMYNCQGTIANNIHHYSYDALCCEVLRFNEDGTVDEWYEADPDDFDLHQPNVTHPSIEEWKVAQLKAIAIPE